VTSADERRRQIVICPPFYAAGLAISPCGAVLLTRFSIFISSGVCLSNLPQVPGAKSTPHRSYVRYYALHAGVRVPFLEFNFVRRVSRRLPKHKKMTIAEWDPIYLSIDNSPVHSRYSELSLSQQSYQVSPEPTIHDQEQVDTY
jgi:hypothetical protein